MSAMRLATVIFSPPREPLPDTKIIPSQTPTNADTKLATILPKTIQAPKSALIEAQITRKLIVLDSHNALGWCCGTKNTNNNEKRRDTPNRTVILRIAPCFAELPRDRQKALCSQRVFACTHVLCPR